MRDTSHANTCQWVEIQWTHKTIFQLFAKSTVSKQKVSIALHGNKGITNWHSSIMSLLFLVILPEQILFEVCLFRSPIQNYVVVFNLYPVFRISFWCHSVKVQIFFFPSKYNLHKLYEALKCNFIILRTRFHIRSIHDLVPNC